MNTPRTLLLLALALPVAGCGDDGSGGDGSDASTGDAPTTTDAPTTDAPTTGAPSTSEGGESTDGDDESTGDPPAVSNVDKAVALIDAFETGDTAALDFVAETYTQHNLAFPDGKAVLEGLLTGRPTGFETTTYRAFEDGNIVFMHNEFGGAWNGGTPQVTFDVFLFDDDGLITEHWDNLADVVDDMDGTTQVDGPTEATALEDTEANRTVVEDALQALFVEGQWSTLSDHFDLENYIQHTTGAGPDSAGLQMILGGLPDGTPFYSSVEYVYAMGDMVLSMSEGFPNEETGLSDAYYDLFRVEDGLIIEHWDIVQTIPAPEDWANDNGKW